MKHINKGMIGMKLKEYTFRINTEIITALDNYEMRGGEFPSLTFIINDFLENLMIDKGFLKEPEVEVGEVFTPFKVENSSKNKRFKRTVQNNLVRLHCGELDFSSHSFDMIDEVENKLNEYPDEKLIDLAVKDNMPRRAYKQELYLKLGLINQTNLVQVDYDPRYDNFRVRFSFKKINYYFGSHTRETADKVCRFLNSKLISEMIKYSSKIVKKKKEDYNAWLYSEMEKEEQILEGK